MKKKWQMSESITLGIWLAMAGGYMDAYSYLCRDEVFANAQTGNMLLFGVYVTQGRWEKAFQYICPVLAFTLGIILSELVRHKWEERHKFHWRQIAVLLEAMILVVVCFVPAGSSLFANTLTSLASGIQVETFRSIPGNGIATTTCLGNLRSGTQHLCDYLIGRDKSKLFKSLLYFGIIICFVIGAVWGSVMIKILHEKAIIICSILLFIVFGFMFMEEGLSRRRVGE